MKIAFDLRRIRNPGIGRYMQCLVEAVLAQATEHEFLLVLPPDAQEMVSINGCRAEKLSCELKYYSLREQLQLPQILRRHHVDLLHSPHFMMPLRPLCPTVVTIHDVIYLACKEDLPSWAGRAYYRGMMAASARKADRIITVSEFSKSEIIHWLHIDPARIEVIHSGISPTFQRITDRSRLEAVCAKYGITREFILFAGIYKPRKNHAALLRAFQKMIAGGVAAQLVIAGPLNEGEAELKRLASELTISNHVILTGRVSDSDLAALYSAARVYACPSLYEGFGFTVLEAMACGAPVVCSPATSLPEVAGEAAFYADPRVPELFTSALTRIFTDDELRARLIQKGQVNCRRFSWKNAAARTITVYESAAGKVPQRVAYGVGRATNGHGGKAAKIAFDTWCLGGYARNHGVHVYAGQLLSQFREMGPQFGVEVMPYVSAGTDNQANNLSAAPGFHPRQTGLLKFSRLWRYGGACTLASLQGVDLVFSPHCTSLYLRSLAPAVVTIHDVIPLMGHWGLPRISQILRFFLWWSAKTSRAIITVSEYSRMDLLNAYGLPESKVFVIYNGYDKEIFNLLPAGPGLVQLLQKFGITRPYILHHGLIKPNKNLARLIHAHCLLRERNPNLDLDLVLAGPLGWEYQDVVEAANQCPGNVIFTGALCDQDLGMLVKGASLAVFPSLYEGFCLPMVEAMACGVPSLAANCSCMPEISGGVLRYFNPRSEEEMSACMEEVLESTDLRKELSVRGQERANQFDWRRSAQQTLEVLKQQLANGN